MRQIVFILVFLFAAQAQASCWRGGALDAGSSQQPHIQLWNPSPNLYLEVTDVYVGSTGSWVFGRSLYALPELFQDTRGISNQFDLNTGPCIGEIRAADGFQPLGQMVNNTGSLHVPVDFIIPPWFGLTIRGGANGSLIRGSFRWTEHQCAPPIC